MAIDPDMEPIIEALEARIAALETAAPAAPDQALDDAIIGFNDALYSALAPLDAADRVALFDRLRAAI